jgi:hypothetical protein
VAVTLTEWLSTRTPRQLADLLAARPDATSPPVPRHLTELAERLEIFHSVARATHELPKPAVQAIEVLQLLGPGAGSREALAGWLGLLPDDPALARILTMLADRALVWPDGEALRMADPLYGAFRYPLLLGPPASVLLARYPAEQLRRIARTLGTPLPSRKQELLAGIVAVLGNPDQVRGLVGLADPKVRARLQRLAQAGPEAADGGWYGYHQPDPSLRWAVERGMVAADSLGVPQLVREVAVALRGPGWHAPFTPDRPEPALAEVDGAAVAREAAAAGSVAVEQITTLLEAVAAAPVSLLKAGGVGVKELRRLAKGIAMEERTLRLWLELAYEAEVVAPVRNQAGSAQLLPTQRYDEWAASAPAERLAALLPVWAELPAGPLLGRAPDEPKPPPALARDQLGQLAVTIRQRLIALTGTLPAGHGVVDPAGLAETMAWHSPLLVGAYPVATELVTTGWREAQLLGVVAHGALSPLGRALLAGSTDELAAACRTLLPPAIEQAVFQADLTALVPGTPARALAELLDAAGDRESRGGAATWRFTAGSVRRALDAGHRPDELLAAMRARAVGGALPQPLTYLVGDVARRHGSVRVRAVACVLRVDDPALVAELAGARALRSLELAAIAPTVLGSAAPVAETLAALRAAGYAPVAESADGTVEVEQAERLRAGRPRPAQRPGRRPPAATPDPVDPKVLADRLLAAPMPAPRQRPPEPEQAALFSTPEPSDDGFQAGYGEELDVDTALEDLAGHLTPGERRLLAHAIETADPVTIGYTNAQGNHTTRVIDSAELDGTHLVAWCQLRDDERMFTLHRIDSVSPAP